MTETRTIADRGAGRTAPGLVLTLALVLAVGSALPLGSGAVVRAQARPAPDLGSIQVAPATGVILQLRDGPELTGALVRVSADTLVLDLKSGERRTVPAGMVATVWTRGDRLTNGALIGGVVGLAGGLLGQSGCTGCGRERAIGVLVGVPLWAGVGAWLDARHAGRTLVYRAPAP